MCAYLTYQAKCYKQLIRAEGNEIILLIMDNFQIKLSIACLDLKLVVVIVGRR